DKNLFEVGIQCNFNEENDMKCEENIDSFVEYNFNKSQKSVDVELNQEILINENLQQLLNSLKTSDSPTFLEEKILNKSQKIEQKSLIDFNQYKFNKLCSFHLRDVETIKSKIYTNDISDHFIANTKSEINSNFCSASNIWSSEKIKHICQLKLPEYLSTFHISESKYYKADSCPYKVIGSAGPLFFIWDLRESTSPVLQSEISFYSHRTYIQFLNHYKKSYFAGQHDKLLSADEDKLFLWSLKNFKRPLESFVYEFGAKYSGTSCHLHCSEHDEYLKLFATPNYIDLMHADLTNKLGMFSYTPLSEETRLLDQRAMQELKFTHEQQHSKPAGIKKVLLGQKQDILFNLDCGSNLEVSKFSGMSIDETNLDEIDFEDLDSIRKSKAESRRFMRENSIFLDDIVDFDFDQISQFSLLLTESNEVCLYKMQTENSDRSLSMTEVDKFKCNTNECTLNGIEFDSFRPEFIYMHSNNSTIDLYKISEA
ncbi:MAG: hypothetical protein MHPSP_000988, partial [Paramarteilia canceri]